MGLEPVWGDKGGRGQAGIAMTSSLGNGRGLGFAGSCALLAPPRSTRELEDWLISMWKRGRVSSLEVQRGSSAAVASLPVSTSEATLLSRMARIAGEGRAEASEMLFHRENLATLPRPRLQELLGSPRLSDLPATLTATACRCKPSPSRPAEAPQNAQRDLLRLLGKGSSLPPLYRCSVKGWSSERGEPADEKRRKRPLRVRVQSQFRVALWSRGAVGASGCVTSRRVASGGVLCVGS